MQLADLLAHFSSATARNRDFGLGEGQMLARCGNFSGCFCLWLFGGFEEYGPVALGLICLFGRLGLCIRIRGFRWFIFAYFHLNFPLSLIF